MGLFNLFKDATNSAKARLRIFNLEQRYLNIISNSSSNAQLNKDLLHLFFEMATIAWNENSCRCFYEKNNIPNEWFNQLYISCSFSGNNEYIKAEQKLLSNLVLVDNPEKFEQILLTIFINSVNDQQQFDVDKSSADFLLECARAEWD